MNIWTNSLGKLRSILIINLSLICLLPIFGLVELSWGAIGIATGVWFAMNQVGTVTGFHRFLCHNAFKFKFKIVEWLFLALGTIAGVGSPLGWTILHRLHHRHSDKPGDPHPMKRGFWNLQFLNYDMSSPDKKWVAKDIMRKPIHLWLHNYYLLVLGAYVLILWGIFGIAGVYYGFCLPSVTTMFSSNLINWATHNPAIGYETYDCGDGSRNVPLMFFGPLLGECWHNNHHRYPSNWTTQEKWWEIDPAGLIVRMVKA